MKAPIANVPFIKNEIWCDQVNSKHYNIQIILSVMKYFISL